MSKFICKNCGKYTEYDNAVLAENEKLEKELIKLKAERNETVKRLRNMIVKMARENKA